MPTHPPPPHPSPHPPHSTAPHVASFSQYIYNKLAAIDDCNVTAGHSCKWSNDGSTGTEVWAQCRHIGKVRDVGDGGPSVGLAHRPLLERRSDASVPHTHLVSGDAPQRSYTLACEDSARRP